MHVSNTESNFVTGHQDIIKFWSNNTKECVFELSDAHHGNIFSTRITPDEKYIISTSRDSTVKIWDINMRSLLKTFEHVSSPKPQNPNSFYLIGATINYILTYKEQKIIY